MSLTIYHNPKCSTSRKVLKALEEAGVKPKVVEYLKTPPTVDELKAILKKGKMKATDLLRKRDKVYKELFADKDLTEEQWLEAIHKYPSILERPLCVSEDKAAICRPIERYREFL